MAKYCIHCGKQISDNAVFCRYCGKNPDVADPAEDDSRKTAYIKNLTKEEPVNNAYVGGAVFSEPERKSRGPSADAKKTQIVIKTVAITLVVVAAIIGALLYFRKPPAPVDTGGQNTEQGTDDTAQNKTDEDQNQPDGSQTEEEQANDSQIEEEQDQTDDSQIVEDSRYRVGYSYTVQTNLRVRAGPGKEYRILERKELAPEDYAQSVNSKTTKDALLEKGSVVTCQGMDGNWMRIESGWICVEDEGEILVK